jgi:HNH endonuclease
MNWFLSNTMSQYNVNSSLDPGNLMNDHTNAVLLRSDLHSAFDERQFAFFPKNSQGYTVHMLEPTLDIGPLYHNTLLHSVIDCAVQFFYARFAWAIFPSLAAFLSKPSVKRIVISVRNDGDGTSREAVEVTDKTDLKVSTSASRSNSPKKRNRAVYSVNNDKDFQSEQRGQKRKQFSSSHATLSTQYNTSTSLSTTPDTMTSSSQPSKEDAELEEISNNLDSPILRAFEYPGQETIQRLKQNALAKQRPPDFEPPNFQRRMPAREALELMGVEVIDEEDLGSLD